MDTSLRERLAELATDDGILAILAIDHRDSLRALLDPANPRAVPPGDLTEFKRTVLRGAGHAASGVMLEPEYSIPQLVEDLPDGVGFLAALEAQGYQGDPYARVTSLMDGWSVARAAAAGASGAKLLIFYTPDVPEAAARQDELVHRVATECVAHGLPLFLEPLAYPARGGTERAPGERRRLVVETARRLTGLGPAVLKLQFPADVAVDDPAGWDEACAELSSVLTVPWALLSLGASFEVFEQQVAAACRAGASGFMVGRAIWGELVEADPDRRPELAAGLVAGRLRHLRELATELATPLRL